MTKNKLHTIFSSSACISENVLLKYVNKELSNIQRNEVEQHNIDCKFCSDAIEGFETNKNSVSEFIKLKEDFSKKRSNLIYYISAIAASILIVFMFNNTSKINNNSNTASNFKSPEVKKHLSPKANFDTIKLNQELLHSIKEETITVERKQYFSKDKKANIKKPLTIKAEKESIPTTSKDDFTYSWSPVKEVQKEDKITEERKSEFEELKKDEKTEIIIIDDNSNEISVGSYKLDVKSSSPQEDEVEVEVENINRIETEKKINSNNNLATENNLHKDKVGQLKDEFIVDSYDSDKTPSEPIEVSSDEIEFESQNIQLADRKKKVNKNKERSTSSKILKEEISEKAPSPFYLGKQAYKSKDWNLAIQQLSDVKKETTKEYYEASYLIGKSYLELNKNDLAKKHFTISSHLNSEWKTKSDTELNKLK